MTGSGKKQHQTGHAHEQRPLLKGKHMPKNAKLYPGHQFARRDGFRPPRGCGLRPTPARSVVELAAARRIA
jgi:hypothetical protein